MQRFAGKVAIVTGASSGMGLATAHQLAAEGAKVIMASNDQAALDAAVADVQARSGTAHAVFADVCSDADNKRMADTAVEQFGGLNAAFINAGIVTDVTLSQVTDEAFDKIFHTNSKSVAFALKHFLPAIEKSGGNGSVVVNSSVASRTGCTEAMGFVLYAASKAANNMMTQYASLSVCYCCVHMAAAVKISTLVNILVHTMLSMEAAAHGTR
eukprot:19266-Heterococcus_DN1.PRE.1